MTIITDKTVDFNRPDIVVIDRKNKIALAVDMAVPLVHNFSNTETEKITNYENLALEIKKKNWKLNNIFIYPLVISAEGVVTTSFRKYLDNIR
jgi:hypothetical protein